MSKQNGGKTWSELQQIKNKNKKIHGQNVKNKRIVQDQKTKLDQHTVQSKRTDRPEVSSAQLNNYDSDDELFENNHSAWVYKNMKGLGAPSYGMCHDSEGILDYELWKEAQCDGDWQ